ncbi:MAG: hypothetical protein SNF33_07605 [Candidatus Algichlamydia australiensis]|nr:hypothetical protein [Chlamydiales bacterium]
MQAVGVRTFISTLHELREKEVIQVTAEASNAYVEIFCKLANLENKTDMLPAEVLNSPYFPFFPDIMSRIVEYIQKKPLTYDVPESASQNVRALFEELEKSKALFVKSDGTFDKEDYLIHAENIITRGIPTLEENEQHLVLQISTDFCSKLSRSSS